MSFVHDAAYSDCKDLANRTVSDKTLKNRAYEIAKIPEYDGYQRLLVKMVFKFFEKTGSGTKWSVNKELAEELQKPVPKKFKRRRAYVRFKDNICAADSPEMGILSSKYQGVKYLLRVIDLFTKYACVKPLIDKKR